VSEHFYEEKNKFISKSISWSLEPKNAIKNKSSEFPSRLEREGGLGGWDRFPTFTVSFIEGFHYLPLLVKM